MSRKDIASLPLEIERKFLIEYPDLAWLEHYPARRKTEMVQTYLISGKGEARRVRQCTENGDVTYFRTSKRKISSVTRIEIEDQLEREAYLALLEEAAPEMTPIVKTRYTIPFEGQSIEVDVYPFWNDRAIAEVELENEEQDCRFPEQIRVIAEVSGDERYSNYSLARSRGMIES